MKPSKALTIKKHEAQLRVYGAVKSIGRAPAAASGLTGG
jgi:hypothetical protein